MTRVYRNNLRPFDSISTVAIAVGETRLNQRHTGILYRDDDTVTILELCWNHDLQRNSPDPSFLWADPTAHPRRLAHAADMCRLVWKANQTFGIPYGFSPPTECFDPVTGQFLLGPDGYGLTCATFVLAVFHRVGLPLVVYDTWPIDRPGDREWQQQMVSLLKKTHATPEHVAGVERDVGVVRFRPEEVAGASTIRPTPVAFTNAIPPSEEILALIANPARIAKTENASITERLGAGIWSAIHSSKGGSGRFRWW